MRGRARLGNNRRPSPSIADSSLVWNCMALHEAIVNPVHTLDFHFPLFLFLPKVGLDENHSSGSLRPFPFLSRNLKSECPSRASLLLNHPNALCTTKQLPTPSYPLESTNPTAPKQAPHLSKSSHDITPKLKVDHQSFRSFSQAFYPAAVSPPLSRIDGWFWRRPVVPKVPASTECRPKI